MSTGVLEDGGCGDLTACPTCVGGGDGLVLIACLAWGWERGVLWRGESVHLFLEFLSAEEGVWRSGSSGSHNFLSVGKNFRVWPGMLS
ncbi:hypothetical protein FKM82_012655 [Ascaphus truei]